MAAYHVSARYVLVGRITEGTYVKGYVVFDRYSKTKSTMEKGVVEQLALNKQVYNSTAQVYGNIVNMKGINCKLSELPRFDEHGNKVTKTSKEVNTRKAEYEIVGKVQKGRKVLGYVLVKLNSNQKDKYNLEKSQVLKLAREGKILNAKCQMYGDKLMLRAANGYDLTKLPVYNIT